MAEKASRQTERELVALRASVGADVDALLAQAKADADPRRWVRRNPLAAAGTLGSIGALVAGALARRGRGKKPKKGAPPPPARDRLTDVAVTAAGTLLTAFAARSAKRFAGRLFDDEDRRR